jgi:glycosyltransferase involved in cell wall biosynthesis
MLATSLKSLQDVTVPPAPRTGIVIAHLGSGGAEKAVVVLANSLAERGYAVDLLTWHAARFYLKDVSPKGATVNLSAWRRPNRVQIIRSLMQYMRQKQPAVIFRHLEKPSLLVIVGGLLTGYRRIVPCIQIDITAYAAIHHKMQHRLRRRLLISLVAALYRLSPRVVAVSEGAARTARRLLSPFGPSVQIIYNGADYSVLLSKAQQPVEEVWLRHKTVPVIVTCGRLTQQKAQDTLLRASAALRGTMPVRLVNLWAKAKSARPCWSWRAGLAWPRTCRCRELSPIRSPGLPKATYSFWRRAAKANRWCTSRR